MYNSRVKLAVSLGLLLSLSEAISSVLLLREEDRDSGKNVITDSLLVENFLSAATGALGVSPYLNSKFLAYSSIALCFSALVPVFCAGLSANGSISQSGWDAGAIFGICAGLFLGVLNMVWLSSSCARVRENPEAAPLLPQHQLPEQAVPQLPEQALPYYSRQRTTDQPVRPTALELPLGVSLEGVTEGAPDCFICPITHHLMLDPVVIMPSGHSYDRSAIEQWLQTKPRDPKTQQPASTFDLVVNWSLRGAIEIHLSGFSASRDSSSPAPSAESSFPLGGGF